MLLFGAKHDSVPVLLRRVRERLSDPPEGEEPDPVLAYVTFLSARQLVERVRGEHPDFWTEAAEVRRTLEEELARLPELREGVLLTGDIQSNEGCSRSGSLAARGLRRRGPGPKLASGA